MMITRLTCFHIAINILIRGIIDLNPEQMSLRKNIFWLTNTIHFFSGYDIFSNQHNAFLVYKMHTYPSFHNIVHNYNSNYHFDWDTFHGLYGHYITLDLLHIRWCLHKCNHHPKHWNLDFYLFLVPCIPANSDTFFLVNPLQRKMLFVRKH